MIVLFRLPGFSVLRRPAQQDGVGGFEGSKEVAGFLTRRRYPQFLVMGLHKLGLIVGLSCPMGSDRLVFWALANWTINSWDIGSITCGLNWPRSEKVCGLNAGQIR